MSLTILASLMITYAVVQTIVLLLLLRFVDPYEREPASLLALMALWGAVGAKSGSDVRNTAMPGTIGGGLRARLAASGATVE